MHLSFVRLLGIVPIGSESRKENGGEDGEDTYVWNLGDGDDRIADSSTGLGEEDVLRLGKGVQTTDRKSVV